VAPVNSFWELSSGYVRRGGDRFPRQAAADPWYRPQNMPRDRRTVMRSPVENAALEFTRARDAAAARTEIAV
jgi:hypothetical protein